MSNNVWTISGENWEYNVESIETTKKPDTAHGDPLFEVDMMWGLQPVHLTAWRCDALPTNGHITSVHIIALFGRFVLVVRDRRGMFGYPGGRLDPGESCEEAMVREVVEEADAKLDPNYRLFAIIRIDYTERLPNRSYPHPYSYMGVYAGRAISLEPSTPDPAGIVRERDLFTIADCNHYLQEHDRILLREALCIYRETHGEDEWLLGFLKEGGGVESLCTGDKATKNGAKES